LFSLNSFIALRDIEGPMMPFLLLFVESMVQMTKKILLNEILQLDDLNNVKIRFNLMFRDNWNPIEVFKSSDIYTMLEGQY
jgi:hypothetical protein